MNATLIVDGKEFPIEILDKELQKLISGKKNTGYEKETGDDKHYVVSDNGTVLTIISPHPNVAAQYYDLANYYSSKEVAENNARADRLMRQLRRFAVEHRDTENLWIDENQEYYSIYYDYRTHSIEISSCLAIVKKAGNIYFESKSIAREAISEFKKELLWYFTEYKDSL